VVIDEQIERQIAFLTGDRKVKSLTLKVSPILGSYLKRGLISFIGKWKRKYKCKINLVEVTDFTVLQFEFCDEKGNKLES
jgi:ribonuclease G